MCNGVPPKARCRSDLAVVSLRFLLSAHGDLREVPCEIEFCSPWRLHPMSMDALGIEPTAFRMRGGSDTTTPRAPGKITALHVHRATTAGEVSWLWAQQEKSGPPVVQDDKTLLAVFEKRLRGCNSPVCNLSQNGYGDRWVKARKCTCCLPVDKITALHVHGASRGSGYGEIRRSVGHQ